MTPVKYHPLVRQVFNYSYEYNYVGQSITYTQQKKARVKLIPVSSEIRDFMDRRILLNLRKKESDAIKSSLVKDQKKKAGGLFQITIPIRSRTFQSIFGEGGAGLKVSGFRKITFAGRSTWDDKQQSAINRQSKFPTLNMEQIYRFDISGTIGSKISVKVSQDSRNNLPLANRLILRYKGAEDDILQSIEAGNTTLDLPSTQFLRYSTRVQGLFGIKATAQVADLAITAIASQEKGSTESIEISAGSSSKATTTKRDIDYQKRTIFDLGRLPIDRAGSDTIPEDPFSYDFYPGDSIKTAIIYIDRKPSSASDQAGRLPGVCYVDPPPHDTLAADPLNEYSVVGEFERVEDADFYFHPTAYYVQFLRPVVQSNHILAVYLEVVRADGSIDFIGDKSAENDTLRLKLIKPTTHTKINHHIWEYEWKNIYWLGGSNVDMSELDVTIFKGARTNINLVDTDHPNNQNGINYIQVMGLDDYDESNTARPDGKIDKNTGLIDAALGLLYFPSRHPFDPGRPFTIDEQTGDSIFLNDTVPELYLSTNNNVVNASSKYYLGISSRQRGGSTIDLKTTNIIDGSEVVTYNNTRLSKGTDYNIDYDFGTLTLLKDEYSDIDANLSVMFETAPFFSLSKKTLLGTRFQYDRSKDFRIGATILYKSDKSTNRKPKIGEETSSMLVWDVDFKFNFENSLINKMIDVMPLLTARAKSYMQISGEIAQSRPNPNVDGEVYVDDFEGAKDSYSLSTYRTSWNFASRPVVTANSADTISERARLAWYNPINDGEYNTVNIYNRDQANSNIVRVMKVLFSPVDKIYKDTVEIIGEDTTEVIDSSTYLAPELSWNGFMRYIPSGVTSQLQNAQLLELRVRGDKGIMHIDLGRITEDINGDGNLNREDKNNNRILDEGEDTGLDGKFSFDEYAYSQNYTDPSGDNYRAPDDDGFYDINNVWYANGTEENADDPDFSSPDTEDRNNNGFEKTNSYFSFKIDLSDTLDYSRGFYVPGTQNEYGWKTIRIPVRDPANLDTIIGAPSWSEIMFARVWFDSASVEHIGAENAIELEIAAIDMVSTSWADSLFIADSIRSGDVKFDVAVINDEIDENYVSPPNVSGFEDQATGITEKEQSLLLTYSNLNGGVLVNSPDSGLIIAADTGLAVRKMYRPNNYMGYGKLEAYIHGDANTDGSILYFFRLGFDKFSYYEFRDTLRPGWDDNYMLIDFNEISGLKAKLLSDRAAGIDSSLVRDEGKYRVKVKNSGNDPSLTRIQYFTVGVVNLNPDEPASGELWIDELRLTDVRDDIGMAARLSLSGNLADLFTYNFGYSNQDAFYRGIATSTRGGASNNLGSGKTQTTYSFNGNLKLDKFLPSSLGLSLPVGIGWSQSVQEPLLRSNTDIVVPEELREKETSFTISKNIRITPKFNKQTKNIIFTGFLNRLTTSFSYKVTNGHSPTRPEHFSENYSSSASYQLSITKVPAIKPLFWTGIFKPPWGLSATKLYLFPTRLSFSGTLTGSYSRSRNQTGENPPSIKRDFKGRVTTRFKIFDNLGGDYSFNTNRNLIDPNTIILTLNPKKFKLGIEQTYDQSFKAAYTPRILGFLTHKFDYSVSYNDRFNLSTDSVYYHNAGRKKNIGVGIKFNHQTLFGTNKRGSASRAGSADSSMFLWKMFRFGRKGFRYITDAIEPVGLKLSYGESRTSPNLSQKAALPYRFGFSDDPGVDEVSASTRGSVRRIHSEDWKLSGSSGVALFSGISATVSFSRNIHETFINSPSKTITVVWPDVTFKLRSIKGLWYFGKVMNFLSPSSGFKRNTESKRHTLEPFPMQEKERISFSPLISFSLSPTRSIKTTVRVENSTTKTTKYNESTGVKTVMTRGTVNTYSFNAGFNYRNPNGIKLPLFGRIRFQSTLSISVDVSYRKSRDEEAKPSNDYEFNVTTEKTNLSIRPTISYSFSNTVKGSLSGRWQDSNDLGRNRKSHTREISITIELRF